MVRVPRAIFGNLCEGVRRVLGEGRHEEAKNGRRGTGDLYICSSNCHKDDRQEKMLTILWMPVA